MKNNLSFQNCSNSAHEPCNAAVSAASSRGVPPREGTRGGTPRELAGGDACATTAASVQGFNARNSFSVKSPHERRSADIPVRQECLRYSDAGSGGPTREVFFRASL